MQTNLHRGKSAADQRCSAIDYRYRGIEGRLMPKHHRQLVGYFFQSSKTGY